MFGIDNKPKICVFNLPIEWLHPHPHNPRKDLGDLSELVESIKAVGIKQNLTVVPDRNENGDLIDDSYTVIIGHRRMAAAKAAGFKELPCAIDMEITPAEQIALMLHENMQRRQLTPLEEGLSFQQLQLEFGWPVGKISDYSGFSETTVRDRLRLTQFDKTKVKKAYEQLNNATVLSRTDVWNASKYKFFVSVKVPEGDKVDENFIAALPTVPEGQRHHYIYYDRSEKNLEFYSKVKHAPAKSSKEAQKERENIANNWADLEAVSQKYYELRKHFVENFYCHSNEQIMLALQGAVYAVASEAPRYTTDQISQGLVKVLGIPEKAYSSYDARRIAIIDKVHELKRNNVTQCVYQLFSDSAGHNGRYGWDSKKWPVYRKRPEIIALCTWLESLGYETSPEEKELIDGTHEVFHRKNN